MIKNLQNTFLILLTALLFQISLSGQIVINEINYHSADEMDSKDWMELYNNTGSQVDISNWVFKDDNDDNSFTFPEGTSISGNGYLVVVRNIDSFSTIWPSVLNYVGEFDFGLNNGGELLRLFDDTGAIIDTVNYDDEDPWPIDADGAGSTLQLTDPNLDNALASSWTAPSNYGTPGAPNSTSSTFDTYGTIQLSVAPNPVSVEAKVKINTPFGFGQGQLMIFNTLGQMVKSIVYEGEEEVNLDVTSLSSGTYTLRLVDRKNETTGVVKFVVL